MQNNDLKFKIRVTNISPSVKPRINEPTKEKQQTILKRSSISFQATVLLILI